MKCKAIALGLLLVMVILQLAGCSTWEIGDYNDDSWDEEWSDDEDDHSDDESSDYPVISDAEELRDFLYASIEKGDYDPKFSYTGDEDDITARNIARILSAYFVKIRSLSDGENNWQVLYTEYPGDRIVAAYQNDDTSELSADEKEALNVAIEVVRQAKAVSTNPVEIELYLHDWLCDQVTYYNGSTDVKDEDDILRHLTALGALLDGQANCQGYTDGFYVLAAIAGFDVGRQSCIADGAGHSFNTICLDGKWYVVDVTFNDDTYRDNGQYYQDYRLFNAGTQECNEYTWPDEYEYHRLQKKGGDVYYYALTEEVSAEHGYTKCYDDIDDVTDAIVAEWKNNGREEIHMMLQDEQADWKDLELGEALDATGLSYQYQVWSIVSGDHTYFYVRFE